MKNEIASLTRETKQKIMDLLMGKEHLSIGEIRKKLGLSTIVVAGVVVEQIKTYHYLEKDVD